MKPYQIAKSNTEHAHQSAFMAFCAVATLKGPVYAMVWAELRGIPPNLGFYNELPFLKWIHAIPNGGSRGDTTKGRAIRGANLRAEGVKAGVHDVFLPFPKDQFPGLYIEFKSPKLQRKGLKEYESTLTPEQKEFRTYIMSVGYESKICYTWQQAVEVLFDYLF